VRGVQFANPEFFGLLALLPLLIFWYWRNARRDRLGIRVSTLNVFSSSPRSWRQRARHAVFVLRIAAVALVVVALARPQSSSRSEQVRAEGIDIMLVNDISGSMLAEDLRPNRVEAAKKVAIDFVKRRPNDRIGVVVFSGESFTLCPLTVDHSVVESQIRGTASGQIEDGTAIGMGLATAVNRLKQSTAKSRVIILITDGVNNRGFIDPLTAADIAHSFGIRVYTIGVGTKGLAPYPFQTPYGVRYQNIQVEIDEASLRKIAAQTGGKYFRAADNRQLESIYQDIDRLEKTKMEVSEFRRHGELFYPAAATACGLLFLELTLAATLFRRFP
jgi:Ca-activated chloride channel family protein